MTTMTKRATLLGLVLALALAPEASAQIPLPFFKKKKKEPAAAQKPPAEAPAPGASPAVQAPAAGPKADSGAKQPDSAAPAVRLQAPPPQITPSAAAGTLSPEEKAALDQAIQQAIAADVADDTTSAHINERIQRWLQVVFRDPQNQVAQQRLQQAQNDLQTARSRALEAGKADQQSTEVVRSHLGAARADINAKNWASAEQHLGAVLQQDPNHPEAKSLMAELQRSKRMDDLKRQALYIVPVLVILAAGLVLVVRWGAKYREERQRKAEELAAKRAAVLQIVDGIGRGKLVTIDREKGVFKIGAAQGPGEDEKNDLVVSDSGALVSRFHCTLLRKEGDYYLVDASMNGTALNGKPVRRGEHYRLDDGDEITVAEVSRLKFLHT
jgi:FHA domain/Tetratricopeptide repeat